MNYLRNFFGHLKNIIVHKWWVFYYACKFGIPWRGFMHDWSKFHPIEFCESLKFYQGNSSPIPACKKTYGYSKAWQHHKGHNPHHYEYWTDNYDSGSTKFIPMPYEYVMEMLADWFAAGRTYKGKDFKIRDEVEWWYTKRENPYLAIAEPTKAFINMFMYDCDLFMSVDWVKDKHNTKVLKQRLEDLYINDKYLR